MTPRPFLFLVPTGWLSPTSLSRFVSCSTGGGFYRTMHSITFLYLHDYEHNIERIFPMTERVRGEWGNEMVPVQLRILIKELGDHVGHVAAPLGWPDLHCVTKEEQLPPRG